MIPSNTLVIGNMPWRVLMEQTNRCLVLCENTYDPTAYNEVKVPADTVWATCTLRRYLNNDFIANWSEEDCSRLTESILENPENYVFGTHGGSSTKDRVFLLSLEEYERFRPALTGIEGWLRTPGSIPCTAAFIEAPSKIRYAGDYIFFKKNVHPAMWIRV